jgi:anti-sigma regulatory factor (Ser/Thr protein kinase)
VLLEHVLSERRTAFFEKPVKIIENITMESYSFFADIIQTEIKRVITNIINNAVEALPRQTGNVSINIYKQESQIIISITDDGSGIPQEVLNSLFSRGFTTKKTGSGLGLFHAKETLMQLGGDIDITSEVGKGTTVFLKIPACERPDWFIHALNVPDNSMVVCVDDSVSIWNAWQERFREFQNNIQLHYCANKEELLLTLAKQTEKLYIYLVDYEFSGKTYTGLDLIKKIMSFKKEEDKVYLVTSRSGEELLQTFCFEHKIYMIPKFFALKIPIKVGG